MDEAAVDRSYTELEATFKEVAASITSLAGKLQLQIAHGDPHAQTWLLDLKGIALGIRQEQQQIGQLLTEIHTYLSHAAGVEAQLDAQQAQDNRRPAAPRRGAGTGLLRSSFGQAVERGAGFAIGEDLIRSFL